MEFISLKDSTRKGKRYVITFANPKRTIHFGSDVGTTYIDEGDKLKRENYIKRHQVREDWTEVNAGSLSRYILWGDSKKINKNLNSYLERFNITKY
jgi:hypothetical protein